MTILPAATHQNLAATAIAAGIELGTGLHPDLGGLNRNHTATGPWCAAAHIEFAGQVDVARTGDGNAGRLGSQQLGPIRGLNQPAEVDRAGNQGGRITGTDAHMAGCNRAPMGNRASHPRGQGHGEEAVATHIQTGRGARGQLDAAKLGPDLALVDHVGGQQGGIAAIGHSNRALVNHRGARLSAAAVLQC